MRGEIIHPIYSWITGIPVEKMVMGNNPFVQSIFFSRKWLPTILIVLSFFHWFQLLLLSIWSVNSTELMQGGHQQQKKTKQNSKMTKLCWKWYDYKVWSRLIIIIFIIIIIIIISIVDQPKPKNRKYGLN